MRRLVAATAVFAAFTLAADASADCRNNFLNRSDGARQVVTLLTGKMTYGEAQKLAAAITAKEKQPIVWLDENGKVLARQFGELKVVRPMPVRCDDKPSGVVLIATFGTVQKPGKRMVVKFDEQTTVDFSEQR